ncbi:hypothetical protein R3P38DRAFT_3532851 [Favolaschia claudopus]|uniref:SnoaL-like domain-containing protein n=1 Tax=Favolaschia claudopus TaxID=2862362 RepID=A0AAW0BF16_9AGAR
MSTLAEKQLQNAQKFLDLLGNPPVDFDAWADLLSPDFVLEYHPATMPMPDGKATRNKAETVPFFKEAWNERFEYIKFASPIDTIQGKDAVVFHVKSYGMHKSGKKYDNEYMFTFKFSGEKIVRMKEFADSKYTTEYFASLHA